MSIATTAQTLLNTPGITVQDLIDFSSFMDPKTEDLFWAEIRRIHPTLCPEW